MGKKIKLIKPEFVEDQISTIWSLNLNLCKFQSLAQATPNPNWSLGPSSTFFFHNLGRFLLIWCQKLGVREFFLYERYLIPDSEDSNRVDSTRSVLSCKLLIHLLHSVQNTFYFHHQANRQLKRKAKVFLFEILWKTIFYLNLNFIHFFQSF
jgi:hypothetical protein